MAEIDKVASAVIAEVSSSVEEWVSVMASAAQSVSQKLEEECSATQQHQQGLGEDIVRVLSEASKQMETNLTNVKGAVGALADDTVIIKL